MMKRLIILATIFSLVLSASPIFADDSTKNEVTEASGQGTIVKVSGTVDSTIEDAVAIVVTQKDDSGILSMQTVAVNDGKFTAEIYVNMDAGKEYIVKVADFNGGDWFTKGFIATETPIPVNNDDTSSNDDNDTDIKEKVVSTKTVTVTHTSTGKTLEVTPVVKEFNAQEYADVKESTVLVSDSQTVVKLASDIAADLKGLSKDGKLPDYIAETDDGAVYKAIAAGKELTIEVETSIVTSDDIKEDAKKIETYVDEIAKDVNGIVQLYLDLNINLLADNKKIAKINKLDYEMEFAIALDEITLSNFENKYIYIVCLHDSNTTYTEATLKGNILYFKTDKFSTYGVITTDSKIEIESPIEEIAEEVVTIEEKPNIALYIGLSVALVAAVGIVVIFAKKKKA